MGRQLCLVFFVLIFGELGFAQTNKTQTWDLSLNAGPLLPQNITGINETFLTKGFRVSKGWSYYRPEIFYNSAEGKEGKLRIAGGSFQNAFYVDDLDGIRPFWTLGMHVAEYQRFPSGGMTFEKARANGVHIGFGLDLPIVPGFGIRNDFVWCVGPGRILLITLGLQWTFGGDSKSDEN